MSSFNPDTFLNTEFSEAFDTVKIPCPEGEFQAMLKDFKTRVTTTGQVVMDVYWIVMDDEARDATGQAFVRLRERMEFDMLSMRLHVN